MVDKKTIIFKDISDHMSLFETQARIKLSKRKHLLQTNKDYLELVSDVTFSILNKLDDDTNVNRFYEMSISNKLHLYILKGIDRNCSSFSAPFLRNKIKIKTELRGEIIEPIDNDTRIFNELDNKKQQIILSIYSMFEPNNAELLFGKHWKYFVTLFTEYIQEPKTSYRSLGRKYNIPFSSVAAHILLIKKIIKNKLKEDENNN